MLGNVEDSVILDEKGWTETMKKWNQHWKEVIVTVKAHLAQTGRFLEQVPFPPSPNSPNQATNLQPSVTQHFPINPKKENCGMYIFWLPWIYLITQDLFYNFLLTDAQELKCLSMSFIHTTRHLLASYKKNYCVVVFLKRYHVSMPMFNSLSQANGL